MDKPESKAERTAQRILDKAAPLFNKKGYAGVSLSDITEATGLTKGAIYCHFKNKDELALKSFEYNLDCIRRYVLREVQAAKSNLDKLHAYPRAYRLAHAELSGMGGCPVVNTAVDSDDTHQELHRQVKNAIEQWRDALIMLVKRGQDKGEIKPGTDPHMIAETVISLVEGGSAMAKATGRKSFVLHSLDQVEALLESIKA